MKQIHPIVGQYEKFKTAHLQENIFFRNFGLSLPQEVTFGYLMKAIGKGEKRRIINAPRLY